MSFENFAKRSAAAVGGLAMAAVSAAGAFATVITVPLFVFGLPQILAEITAAAGKVSYDGFNYALNGSNAPAPQQLQPPSTKPVPKPVSEASTLSSPPSSIPLSSPRSGSQASAQSHAVALPRVDAEEWKKITEAYKKINPQPPVNNTLIFKDPEQSSDFFTEQAAGKAKFLGQELKNGVPTNNWVFSCGDGKLYQGDLKTIKAALEQAKASATSSNSPDIDKISAGLDRIGRAILAEPAKPRAPTPSSASAASPAPSDELEPPLALR